MNTVVDGVPGKAREGLPMSINSYCVQTPGLSCGPQEINSRADKKPTLWAVSSEPLLGPDMKDTGSVNLMNPYRIANEDGSAIGGTVTLADVEVLRRSPCRLVWSLEVEHVSPG